MPQLGGLTGRKYLICASLTLLEMAGERVSSRFERSNDVARNTGQRNLSGKNRIIRSSCEHERRSVRNCIKPLGTDGDFAKDGSSHIPSRLCVLSHNTQHLPRQLTYEVGAARSIRPYMGFTTAICAHPSLQQLGAVLSETGLRLIPVVAVPNSVLQYHSVDPWYTL